MRKLRPGRVRKPTSTILPGVLLVTLTIFLGVVMVRLAFSDTKIPIARSDLAANAATNERLLDVVQWSLSAVMGLGLALVGVNWFQTQRDRNELLELEAELRSIAKDLQDRFDRLQHVVNLAEKRAVSLELMDEIRRDNRKMGGIQYFAEEFTKAEWDSVRKRAAAELLIRTAQEVPHNASVAHKTLVEIHSEMKRYDPELAGEVMEVIVRDLKVASTIPESERPDYGQSR